MHRTQFPSGFLISQGQGFKELHLLKELGAGAGWAGWLSGVGGVGDEGGTIPVIRVELGWFRPA